MNETQIYEQTLSNNYCDDYFINKTYSGTIESSILHLIADMFSDDTLQINGTQIICEDERKERVIQARAMFFWYLNKSLGYSIYAISIKYGFHSNNVGKIIKKHTVNIENEPFIFFIHKKIFEIGEIWKSYGVLSEKNIVIEVKSKHEKTISKLEKKHKNYDTKI